MWLIHVYNDNVEVLNGHADNPMDDFVNDKEENTKLNRTLLLILKSVISLQMIHFLSNKVTEGILLMLKYVFISLNSIIAVLLNLIEEFPTTLYKVWKVMDIDPDDFLKLIVCPICNNIYSYEKVYKVVRGKYITFQCFFYLQSNKLLFVVIPSS